MENGVCKDFGVSHLCDCKQGYQVLRYYIYIKVL